MSRDSTHAAPLGASLHLVALNATRGHTCLTPQPRQVPDAPLGSLHRPGWRNPELGSPAPSPQPPAWSGAANPHLVTGQPALRALKVWTGLGFTKMSPLQVTDQMACGEGRQAPSGSRSRTGWSRGELARGGGVSEAGLAQDGGPHPCPRDPRSAYPVAHVLLSGGGQAHGPPLPRSLGAQGKGVLGSLNTGTSATSLEEHMDVLHAGVGPREPWVRAPAPWGSRDRGPWAPGTGWGPCGVGRQVTVGVALLSRSLERPF